MLERLERKYTKMEIVDLILQMHFQIMKSFLSPILPISSKWVFVFTSSIYKIASNLFVQLLNTGYNYMVVLKLVLKYEQCIYKSTWQGGIGTGRRFKRLIFHLGHADSPAPVSGINGHSEDMNQDSVPKASLRLGFSEYCRISNLIVLHLRKMEEGEAIPSAALTVSFT